MLVTRIKVYPPNICVLFMHSVIRYLIKTLYKRKKYLASCVIATIDEGCVKKVQKRFKTSTISFILYLARLQCFIVFSHLGQNFLKINSCIFVLGL